jgi:hypothetical protein
MHRTWCTSAQVPWHVLHVIHCLRVSSGTSGHTQTGPPAQAVVSQASRRRLPIYDNCQLHNIPARCTSMLASEGSSRSPARPICSSWVIRWRWNAHSAKNVRGCRATAKSCDRNVLSRAKCTYFAVQTSPRTSECQPSVPFCVATARTTQERPRSLNTFKRRSKRIQRAICSAVPDMRNPIILRTI